MLLQNWQRIDKVKYTLRELHQKEKKKNLTWSSEILSVCVCPGGTTVLRQMRRRQCQACQRLCSQSENFSREKMHTGTTATTLKRSTRCIWRESGVQCFLVSSAEFRLFPVSVWETSMDHKKGRELSVVNVKDNVTENELSRVAGFVS